MKQRLQQFFDYFLIGILGILPIVIIVQIVIYIEGLLTNFILSVVGRYDSILTPGVLFFVAIGLLTYFGRLLKQDKAHVLYFLEKLLNRIPVLGTIYRITQKILNLFRGDENEKLRDVVYIEYPKPDVWVPAYVTHRIEDRMVLFVPTSPNPTSGFTVIVHESKTIPSHMTIEEASSFIISLGVDLPKPNEISALPSGEVHTALPAFREPEA